MKCFYHTSSAAIGICKNCGKGICKKCVVDLMDGLACKGKCEEKVKALVWLAQKIRLKFEAERKGYFYFGCAFSASGIGLFIFNLIAGMPAGFNVFSLFFISMGILFYLVGKKQGR